MGIGHFNQDTAGCLGGFGQELGKFWALTHLLTSKLGCPSFRPVEEDTRFWAQRRRTVSHSQSSSRRASVRALVPHPQCPRGDHRGDSCTQQVQLKGGPLTVGGPCGCRAGGTRAATPFWDDIISSFAVLACKHSCETWWVKSSPGLPVLAQPARLRGEQEALGGLCLPKLPSITSSDMHTVPPVLPSHRSQKLFFLFFF